MNRKLNAKIDTIRGFLFKIRTLFLIFKKGQGRSPPFPPSCTPVSVAEYASVSLNMHKYPWKSLNKLFWLCQGSKYAWSYYMFDRLLKKPQVLNKPGFWIWHGCICKGYEKFWICLIMAPYTSRMLEYAWIWLNVPQYVWTWLNIAKCPWISLKMLE